MLRSLCVAFALLTLCAPASAQAPVPAPEAKADAAGLGVEAQIEPGVLPALSALGPGFLLHGAGAFVAGDRVAARRLLIIDAASLSLFLGASSVVALSGASRRLVGSMLPFVAAGGSVFMLGWLADIYAATTGGREVGAVNWATPLGAELSYRYVYDPQFEYRNFVYAQSDVRVGAFRLSPSAWLALDDDNQRIRLDSAYRAWGRTPTRKADDGSYLDLSHAYTLHRYPNDRFSVWTFEARVEGRLDLARIGKSLRGSFAEGQLGAGLELYDFDIPGVQFGDDSAGLLLARFAFGVYFGDSERRTGELQAYYDHRHDDYAAGLGVSGIGGGFLGHFGLEGHYFLSEHWGVTSLFEVGSAYIYGVGLRYRYKSRSAS